MTLIPASDIRIRFAALVALTSVITAITVLAGLNRLQIIAVTLFGFKTCATLLFWRHRLPFAFVAIALLLALGVIDISHLIEFASFDVILFLISMMTVVGFLEERGFFEYLLRKIMRVVGSEAHKLVVTLMLAAAFFAALVDEVTSILFMIPIMLHCAARHRVNPIPFVMMLVFATNIGSSATVIGNPVGVMIAFKGGLTFSDFLRWATPVSVLALVVTIWISTKLFSSDIRKLGASMSLSTGQDEAGDEEATFDGGMMTCGAVFLGTILLLALHQPIEKLLHLEKNTLLIGVAMAAAGITLLIDLERGREVIERRVDWRTLLFFTLLFASVGTLQYVGVTDLLADAILSISGGSDVGLLVILTLVAAVLSAFMDNVLAVAMFLPVVSSIGAAGAHAFPLWWGLLFAGTFFGNLTMIGSTANIVAVGMIEREKRGHISFLEWIKAGAVVSLPTLVLALLLLYLQIPMMPR